MVCTKTGKRHIHGKLLQGFFINYCGGNYGINWHRKMFLNSFVYYTTRHITLWLEQRCSKAQRPDEKDLPLR